MGNPYRELATQPAEPVAIVDPSTCDICGNFLRHGQCVDCVAVQRVVPILAYPVLVVGWWDPRWDPLAGAGFVLIDRWQTIARRGAQFACALKTTAPAMARERAVQWAPGATLVYDYRQFVHALDTERHWSVYELWRRAIDDAEYCARSAWQRYPSPLRPPAVPKLAAPLPSWWRRLLSRL